MFLLQIRDGILYRKSLVKILLPMEPHLLWRDAELVFELSDKFGLPSVAGHVKLSCSNGTEL